MDPMRELPMGFGMALCANQRAMEYFEHLPQAQKQAIIAQTHQIQSSKEMKAFVAGLGQ